MREISPEDMPGTKVRAGFQIVSTICDGIQGTNYKAVGKEPGKSVILKVLHAYLTENPQIAANIEQEIERISTIQHDCIAGVIEHGRTEEGQVYLSSDFVTGPDIGKLISQNVHLSNLQVLDMMLQACIGLRAALEKGILHGDIKPSSLIVDSKSRLCRVVDFGLAGSLHFPQPDSPPCHTGQQPLVGGPGYMSPEHAKGLPIDHRSDIFSLGAVFYHLLAHETIFDVSSLGEYMRLVSASSPLPLKDVSQDVFEEVSNVIMRMLALNPDQRPADYDALIAGLEEAKRHIESRQEMEKEAEQSQAQEQVSTAMQQHHKTQTLMSGGELPDPNAAEDRSVDDVATPPQGMAVAQSTSSAAKSGDVKVDIHQVEEEIVRRRGKFHPLYIVVAFIIVVFIVVTVVTGVGRDKDSEAGSSPGIFQGIVDLFTPSSEKELDPELALMLSNYERMQKVQLMMAKYRAENGTWPNRISLLLEKDLLQPSESLDEWGNQMFLLNTRRQIVAPGPDGEEQTGDDWRVPFEGSGGKLPPRLQDYFLEQNELNR